MGQGLPLLPADVVDRPAWAAAAIDGMAALTAGARLPHTPKVARTVTAATAGLQVGGVLAYLGGRVLGQYDPFGGTDGEGRLLLVAPNVYAAQQALNVPSADFGMWVCLHEATHRLQFTAVPWLRDYFAQEVGRFLSMADGTRGGILERLPETISAIRGSGGDSLVLVELLQGPEQRAVLDRLLALTTLLEGHADHVMDAAGPEVVPSVETIRARFTAAPPRRGARGPAAAGAARRRGEGQAVRRGVGLHQVRRARGGDGRLQPGVGVARDAADARGAGRPRVLAAPARHGVTAQDRDRA